MPPEVLTVVALWAGFLGLSSAAGEDWSYCSWDGGRVSTMRDAVYLDGGNVIQIIPTAAGDPYPKIQNNIASNLYYLNFSSTFDVSKSNLTDLFKTVPKSSPGSNQAPNYLNGAIFGNEGELILYGGVVSSSHDLSPQDDDDTTLYLAHQYGPEKTDFTPGMNDGKLNNDVTRYISNGAAVSAPSENLGLYFSGLHAKDWGPSSTVNRSETSDRLITVDMSSMGDGDWTNHTLPSEVKGRVNAEAVWIPVSTSGVLAIIGGVTDLATPNNPVLSSDQEDTTKATSPSFMETIPIYDIAADKWYLQNTTGQTPPMLAQFCSVYASASDGSSHNIYIYGGYDGLNAGNNRYDDVYVLSLPSFTWIKLYSGETSHGRSGHACTTPYPDQMFVLGGMKINPNECLDIVNVFNLNTGKFQDTYDPTKWSEYKVPDLVTAQIGGDGSGGASKTAPDNWDDDSLADVFSSKYTKTIETYYPYKPIDSNSPIVSEVPKPGGSGFPGWAGGIIGAVLGVALIAAAFFFWCLRQRRKNRQAPPPPKSEMSDRRSRILGWMIGVPKSGETTADDRTVFDGESKVDPSDANTTASPEIMSEPVHEMPDRSTVLPVELPTTYNNGPVTSRPPASPALSSTTGSQNGYVSPMSPGTPEPVEGDDPTRRPSHHRHVSSFSSSDAVPIADVLYGDNTERHPHRQTGVSEISEFSASSEATRVNQSSETTEETRN